MDDDYVAQLMAKEASESSKKYSVEGLGAYRSNKRAADAPRANTRFLRHLIKETDSHNTALKRKEERDARDRMRQLKEQNTRESSSQASSSAPRRHERDRERHSSTRNSDRRHRDESRYESRDERRDEADRSHRRSYRRRSRSTSTERDRSHRHQRKDRDRSRSRDADRDRGHRRRRNEDDRDKPRERDRDRDRNREHRHSRRSTNHSRRAHSESRSRSPRRDRSAEPHRSRHRNTSTDRPSRSHRSEDRQSRRDHDKRSSQKSKHPASREPVERSPRNGALPISQHDKEDDSDPLEEMFGPLPPQKDGDFDAPVRSRGRGAYKPSSSNIDSHFAPDYDPTIDVHPDEDEPLPNRAARRPVAGLMTEEDDWDMALEALRDRARWKQKGEDRLRAAGLNESVIERWKDNSHSSGGDAEKRPEDVRWSKKGEGREWDRGKVMDEKGHTDVHALW